MTRRSTRTVMVFWLLSLTTRPCRTRLGIFGSSTGLRGLDVHDRLHPRDVAADHTDTCGVLGLTAGPLEAQVELLLLEVREHLLQLVCGLGVQIGRGGDA